MLVMFIRVLQTGLRETGGEPRGINYFEIYSGVKCVFEIQITPHGVRSGISAK